MNAVLAEERARVAYFTKRADELGSGSASPDLVRLCAAWSEARDALEVSKYGRKKKQPIKTQGRLK